LGYVTVGATPKAGKKTSEMVHDLTEIALGPLRCLIGSPSHRDPGLAAFSHHSHHWKWCTYLRLNLDPSGRFSAAVFQ
jgi:hypothetical protein